VGTAYFGHNDQIARIGDGYRCVGGQANVTSSKASTAAKGIRVESRTGQGMAEGTHRSETYASGATVHESLNPWTCCTRLNSGSI